MGGVASRLVLVPSPIIAHGTLLTEKQIRTFVSSLIMHHIAQAAIRRLRGQRLTMGTIAGKYLRGHHYRQRHYQEDDNRHTCQYTFRVSNAHSPPIPHCGTHGQGKLPAMMKLLRPLEEDACSNFRISLYRHFVTVYIGGAATEVLVAWTLCDSQEIRIVLQIRLKRLQQQLCYDR